MYVYLMYEVSVIVPMVGMAGSRDTYVGIATNVWARAARHNKGEVTATRGRQWKLVAFVEVPTRGQAAAIERWLKCGDTRAKRLRFASLGFDPDVSHNIWVQIFNDVKAWSVRHPGYARYMQEVTE